ncbi:MAG: response regulator [Gammaproteobacteria bacterium]
MRASNAVLLVEDEPVVAAYIQNVLDDAGYAVQHVATGSAAWAALAATDATPATMLLDRGLPDMEGLDLLRRVKAEPRFRRLPVIIETGDDRHASLQEGIDAGAYFYLTKPFEPDVLSMIVKAAVGQHASYCELQATQAASLQVLELLDSATFHLRTLDEARALASHLAGLFPEPERVASGLLELLVNAIEHGNLGIGYGEKSRLLAGGAWEDEVARRLASPTYADKVVTLTLERSATCLCITIADEGAGFDHAGFLHIDPARAFDLHGRGIALANLMSFDELAYLGCGNRVRACVKFTADA